MSTSWNVKTNIHLIFQNNIYLASFLHLLSISFLITLFIIFPSSLSIFLIIVIYISHILRQILYYFHRFSLFKHIQREYSHITLSFMFIILSLNSKLNTRYRIFHVLHLDQTQILLITKKIYTTNWLTLWSMYKTCIIWEVKKKQQKSFK